MKDSYNGITRVRAWAMMICTYLVGLAAMLAQYQVPPILRDLLESLGSGSLVDGGLLMTVFSIVAIFTSVPVGIILMKIGLRLGAFVTLALLLIGSVAGTFAGSFELMMGARLIEGIGAMFASAVGPAIIALLFPPQRRGLPMAIWSTWVGVAVFISYQVAGPMTALLGGRGMFWWVNIICVVVFVLFALVVRYPRSIEGSQESAKMSAAFKFRKTWLLAVMFLVYTLVVATYNSLAPTYVADTFGLSSTEASAETSWFSFAMIFGALICGVLYNVIASRKKMPQAQIVVCVLVAISFYMMWNIPSLGPIMIVYMLVIGLLFSSFPAMMFTLCPTTVSKVIYGAAAMALLMLGQKIGAAFGPTLAAMIVESSGGWGAMTLPSTACGVILIVLSILYLVWEKNPNESEQEALRRIEEESAAGGASSS